MSSTRLVHRPDRLPALARALAVLLVIMLHGRPVTAQWKLVLDERFDEPGSRLDGWTTFGNVQPSGDDPEGGSALILSAQEAGGYSGLFQEAGGTFVAGDRITATARYRPGPGPADPGAVVQLKLEFHDSGGQLLLADSADGGLQDPERSWQAISVSSEVPHSTATVRVVLILVQPEGRTGSSVFVDDVTAIRQSAPPDLLEDRGRFETSDGGAMGWTAFNNAFIDSRLKRGGLGGLKTWGPFTEPYSGSGVQRRVELPRVVPGEQITAEVFAMTPPGDSVEQGGNFAVLKIECLDRDARVIAHKESRPLDPSRDPIEPGRWYRSSVSMELPEKTASARVILVFVQPLSEGGAIVFDDATLVRSSRADVNLLDNGDFETPSSGITGWTTTGSVSHSSDIRRSGAASMMLKPSRREPGSNTVARAEVIRPRPGRLELECWILDRSSARRDGERPRLLISTDILDEDGKSLGTSDRQVLLGEQETEGPWNRVNIPLDVPGPVGSIRITMELVDAGGTRTTVHVDDMVLEGAGQERAGAPIHLPLVNPGFEGGVPDAATWDVADGAWSHNGELQYYAPDAATIDDGTLVITTRKRPVGDRQYSSAHLSTKGRHEQAYGRWEIRARLPVSQGMWPAIWLLPVDGSWPPEIDIIELVGKEPDTVHHSFHWGPLRDGLKPWDLGQTSTTSTGPMNFSGRFHDFTVEWTPGAIRWYVDRTLTHEHRENIPTEPMYLIINNAVGGFWPGPPGENTRWPETMEIDRVRIWEWTRD